MATILHIETSTDVCSVSVSQNGQLLAIKESLDGMNHSRILTLFIEELMNDSVINAGLIEAVAVSMGPGSYTGLRIGVSVAKGLCYALNIPLLAIGTLDSMASYTAAHLDQYHPNAASGLPPLLCPMIDARRMEVYSALFDASGTRIEPVTAKIVDAGTFANMLDKNPILFFGNGARKCRETIQHPNALFAGPEKVSARFMIHQAEVKYKNNEFEDVAYFEPFYLKDFIATVPRNKVIK